MEVLKQRMQAGRIRNVGEVLKSKDSLRALVSWRLFRAQTLLHDIPYGIVQWSAYAAVKSSLSDEAASDPITPVLAGTLSGGLAALITTPLDVIKTRCIISDHLPIRSIFHGVVKDGIWVLVSRGAVFRVLHIAPATGVYFGLFNLIYSGLAS
jgi:solute carrier family 25 S-adenosylmethionine transporter 26